MMSGRNTTLWMSVTAALFTLSVAIFTQNAALFLLAGLAAATALGTAARKPWL